MPTAGAAAPRDRLRHRSRAVSEVPAREIRVRICVIGAGAIGSLFAAHLSNVAEVLVLTRRPEHARALNEHGLRVTGRHDFTARVTAAADPRELPELDVGIIA